MEPEALLRDQHFVLPSSFFDRIIKDIPSETWGRILQDNPSLREALLEGFSARPNKLARLFRQLQIQVRLRRFLQSERHVLDLVLTIWGQEKLSFVAFLEMLDRSFLLDNWDHLRSLLGPARFLAGLHLLGYLEDADFREFIGEDFWEPRVDSEVVEPLVPIWEIWKEFVRQHPRAHNWIEGMMTPAPAGESEEDSEKSEEKPHESPRREEERRKKLELKLEKAQEEQSQLQQQLARYRKENEELRKKAGEWEQQFENRLEEAIAGRRREWFQRYERYQADEERSLEDAQKHLDSLLKRADRAFELQRQADAQYGLVAAVRQKLLQLELYLKEIERIYGDSLVVHSEVTRVKEVLLQERKRLLQLPGIEKVLRKEPQLVSTADLRQKIRFLEPIPENLSKVTQLEAIVGRLEKLGFLESPRELDEEIEQKKRQILEMLYSLFQPPVEAPAKERKSRSFDDFVRSGQSKRYDIYVDGYNILLKVQGGKKTGPDTSLAAFREEFIRAVCEKSRLFRKVYLVFDGVEDSTDRCGNAEIVYTDKGRGRTADIAIIEALRKRKDNLALLVTADQEIIRETENRVYATVHPYHFYMFIFEIAVGRQLTENG